MLSQLLSRPMGPSARTRKRRLNVEPLELRCVLASHLDAPIILPAGTEFRGMLVEEWSEQSAAWSIAAELGKETDLSDTVNGVRFLPGAFEPGESEFDVEVTPGTAFVINSFFVFGEMYFDGSMDDPNDPIIDVILETTTIRTTLDGEVILEGTTSDLADYSFGPKLLDPPIEYAEPQPRGGIDAIAAKFVLGTGGMLKPLSPGEHTIVNEVVSQFFGEFDITYNISVVPKGKADKTEVERPFKISGGGPAPDGLPLVPGESGQHSATGTAIGLGKYAGEGTFTLGSLSIDATGLVTGTFQGSFVFTASNGDKLAVTYGDGFSGTFKGQLSEDGLSVVNVEFDAFFTPDPAESTGRFADIIGGGWRMLAYADSISLISSEPGFTAPFDYYWTGKGKLVFA